MRRATVAATPRRPDHRRVLGWALAVLLITLAYGTVHRFRGWDQTFYLAQTSSLVEDGDLDLRNDALHADRGLPSQIRLLTTVRPNGALLNTFPIGPSLLWTPAYALSLAARAPGLADLTSTPPELRWSRPQLVALHLLNLGLLLALFWSLDRWLRRLGSPRSFAALATLALVLGSSLLVYGFRQYTTSHLATVLAVTWLLAAAFRVERRPTVVNALLCGLALGAVFLCRWQDVLKGVVLLLPLWSLRRRGLPWSRLGLLSAATVGGALAVASIQLHGWALEWGAIVGLPQGSDYMRWTDPELSRFLLSGISGLLPWSPIFLVGVVGLCLPWRGKVPRAWAATALAILLVDIYINAAVVDWWGGAAYGSRRMISSLPFLAVGLANLGVLARRRKPTVVLLVLCCVWGTFTAHLYTRGVRDLAPVFTGRASDAPGTEREGGIERTPEKEREIALEVPVRYRGINYFKGEGKAAGASGKFATALIMAGFLWLCASGLARARPSGILPVTLAIFVMLVLLGHLRLASGPQPDLRERHLWGDLARHVERPATDLAELEPGVAAAFADPADRFADPRRYVWAWALRQRGRRDEARTVAAELSGRPYPTVDDLERAVALEPGLKPLKSLPGVFHEVEGGSRRRVVVPARLDLATTDVRLGFGLRLPEEPGASRILFAWRLPEKIRPDGRPLVTLTATTTGATTTGAIHLHTPDGEASAASPVWGEGPYRVEIEWLHERQLAVVVVETAPGETLRLEAPASVAPGLVWRWSLVFGRPSGWRPETAPEGAVYSDLRVTAGPE